MTIREAVEIAREGYMWTDVDPLEPVSVIVEFVNADGEYDETLFDLYRLDKVKELEELWEDSHEEMEAKIDSVTYVETVIMD